MLEDRARRKGAEDREVDDGVLTPLRRCTSHTSDPEAGRAGSAEVGEGVHVLTGCVWNGSVLSRHGLTSFEEPATADAITVASVSRIIVVVTEPE